MSKFIKIAAQFLLAVAIGVLASLLIDVIAKAETRKCAIGYSGTQCTKEERQSCTYQCPKMVCMPQRIGKIMQNMCRTQYQTCYGYRTLTIREDRYVTNWGTCH